MTTFTFEASYRESDGGSRCDVIVAPDRDTAIRLAAMEIISDNGWDGPDGRASEYATLAGFYEGEMRITAEWEDLKGTACPNCTSHGGRETGAILAWTTGDAKVFDCSACGYEWAPLGMPKKADEPSAADIAKELDEFEAEHMTGTDPED